MARHLPHLHLLLGKHRSDKRKAGRSRSLFLQAVASAKDEGASYSEIARACGVTKSGAQHLVAEGRALLGPTERNHEEEK